MNLKDRARRAFLCTLSSISPKLNFKYRYRRMFGRKLNLKNPETFNEKIIWLELNKYHNDPTVIKCCDKYLVRDYVTEHGCGDTLVNRIGSWEKISDIPWDKLPERFVLKWNFGAGFNIICRDKSKLDIKEASKQLEKFGHKKYWLWYGETHYKHVPRRIVCEEYISSLSGLDGQPPDDYKLYCFNGKVEYILLCTNRKGMHADYVMYDKDWNLTDFSKLACEKGQSIAVPRPKMLDKAIECSEKLSKDFPFVRVDWYIMEDRIYFGELTFTPCGGLDDDIREGDRIMAELLKIK